MRGLLSLSEDSPDATLLAVSSAQSRRVAGRQVLRHLNRPDQLDRGSHHRALRPLECNDRHEKLIVCGPVGERPNPFPRGAAVTPPSTPVTAPPG